MSGASHSPPPIVLGRGITALGVLRSLGRRGLEPFLAAPPGDFTTVSRFARGRRLSIPETDDPDRLVADLGRAGVHEAVLFPCSDIWAQAVSRLTPGLSRRYPSSSPPGGVLESLVDKSRFVDVLRRFEVPHPRTRLVTNEDDLASEDLVGSFLKPSESQRFSRTYGDKAIGLTRREDVRAGLRAMADCGVHALHQEYVPGPPTCHYFVDGLVDRGGVLRAVFVRRRTRMYPIEFGNSSHMVTVAPETAAPAVAGVSRLLTGLGFRGPFSAEFKRDPRDGVYRLLEVNGRAWWYIGFAASCGVDIASLAYDDALGRPVSTVDRYVVGKRCVLLHLDVQAYLHERAHGLGFGTWLRSVVGATPTVFSMDDPIPGARLALQLGMGAMRKRVAGDGIGPRRGV